MRIALAALLMLAPAASAADEPPVRFPDLVGWYLLGGLNVGAATGDDELGALLGAEASVAHYDDASDLWAGAYADGARDLGRETYRTGVGGEAGWGIFGIDAGLELSLGGDQTAAGVRARGLLTLGVLAVYGAYERIDGEDIGGLGVLLKWPLRITPRRPIWFGR